MNGLLKKITRARNKFDIQLSGTKVLTEAASGNFICTALLAALSGAEVLAVAKNSRYGSVLKIKNELFSGAQSLGVENKIVISDNLDTTDLSGMDIVTNTGFVRPIDTALIDRLKPGCVIPLMWEPWEYRPAELDLNATLTRGIKVYGTNESDRRLQTMSYIGFSVLYFLLQEKLSPHSARILGIGCSHFLNPIKTLLTKNGYEGKYFETGNYKNEPVEDYDAIIIAEHQDPRLILGEEGKALVSSRQLNESQVVIHIAGNVSFDQLTGRHFPEKPAAFGYMSYTADFIDSAAVVDLHAAGLKVAEGMLTANQQHLVGRAYKDFMEENYPALSFEEEKYW